MGNTPMTIVPKEKPVRITVDLSPKFYKRLEALEELVDASSKADVVREALRLYEYLVQKHMNGAEFQLVEHGQPKTVVLFKGMER
jgi:hypothetical protein